MLFNLYIDDLAVEICKMGGIKSYFYADDLAALTKGKIQKIKLLESI